MKRLLISGCSFTCFGWDTDLRDRYEVDNVSYSGAGNKYISDVVIDHLCSDAPQPDAVIVSWSGLTRVDKTVNDPELFSDYPVIHRPRHHHYVFSGGHAGTWVMHDMSRQLFSGDYKFTDNDQFATETLLNMIKLQSFLKTTGIPYYFTFYMDYWSGKYEGTPVYEKTLDFTLNGSEIQHLRDKLDTDRFLFFENGKVQTVYDLALELNDFQPDGFHPGAQASARYANMIHDYLTDKI